jgi:hypothetical protein
MMCAFQLIGLFWSTHSVDELKVFNKGMGKEN